MTVSLLLLQFALHFYIILVNYESVNSYKKGAEEMEQEKGILLESGTNELEIVEFGIGSYKFGMNVIKVKEIINPVPITAIPQTHQNVEGIIELRGEILPVVDIGTALSLAKSENPDQDKFIVAEFNKQKVVFHVQTVTKIHRISWEQIEKPSDMYKGLESQITGVIKLNGEMLLLLDLERIIAEINPESSITVEQIQRMGHRERTEKKLLVAEDSPMLRKLLEDTLKEAGYEYIHFFENGQEALSYLEERADKGTLDQEVDLVITDIEMPQMDGHHLTKRIKAHPKLSRLPVIIFSSLITNDLRHKGSQVGADAQISKPDITELVTNIDRFVQGK